MDRDTSSIDRSTIDIIYVSSFIMRRIMLACLQSSLSSRRRVGSLDLTLYGCARVGRRKGNTIFVSLQGAHGSGESLAAVESEVRPADTRPSPSAIARDELHSFMQSDTMLLQGVVEILLENDPNAVLEEDRSAESPLVVVWDVGFLGRKV